MSCCESTLNCSAQSNASTEDCIIAYKIFDQCRKQICLTPCLLGPARCARNAASCNEILQEGDIIVPPSNAASVSIDDLCLCKILITKKKENAFRTGYWDVEIKFVFSYTITFRDSRPKYSSMLLLLIVILPLPGTKYTLAMDFFLLPVP